MSFRCFAFSLSRPPMMVPSRCFSTTHRRPTLRAFSSTPTDGGDDSAGEADENERVVIKDIGDGIKHVILSRPNKLNSLDMKMFEAIAGAAAMLRDDTTLRGIIISGEGRAFCTGLDVKSVALKGNPIKSVERLLERPSGYGRYPEATSLGNLAQDVGYLWRDIPVPVIASLHGMCFGGGMQIALGADFRFATPDCKMSIMEAKWGLIPDMSASVTLRELVRIDVAKELTMTGRVITGTEAADLGLITRCVEDPMAESVKVAKEIASRSPDSVAAAKELYQETWVAPEEFCLKAETVVQRQLLASWNQMAASGRNFGVKMPYSRRKDIELTKQETHPF
mmetsp:Transcript_6078/g.13239  ORF Transcript_6078/g.13239 Transcript_6078/m.13239 type:complete len:338 (-) Transcript_6078:137-1150(-)|eukprot:CAMPEP_0178505594 /NCGR_PEP_ID=MMETSP0696-20121128/19212_1 /TAXON_ID=265572 /ORGANISM="Extubocellulus spinifer, Strain CCMP396" /LENGTH=337 /DNA_ID=CAMNT_0020134911 /DNA_START=47 /DNA_END=1060 /DNA_ORIENTATION=+